MNCTLSCIDCGNSLTTFALNTKRCYECKILRKNFLQRNNPNKSLNTKGWNLKFNYGISIEQYQKMLYNQQDKCMICCKLMDKPCVDHCHVTQRVRALLCGLCNRGIGMFKEDVESLQNAIKYLNLFNNRDSNIND